jgi:hypothetical protein
VSASAAVRVEDVVGQLVEIVPGPQTHHRQRVGGDCAGPVGAPGITVGDLADPGYIVGVASSPLGVEVTGGIGQQQVQVGNEDLFQETPGDERPGMAESQIGETGACRPGHPRLEIGMGVEQLALAINAARQDHLASFDLPISGKRVLEAEAGIELHTAFFLDRSCSVPLTERRADNVAEIRRRFPTRKVASAWSISRGLGRAAARLAKSDHADFELTRPAH